MYYLKNIGVALSPSNMIANICGHILPFKLLNYVIVNLLLTIEGLYTVRNKACLNSSIKLSFRFRSFLQCGSYVSICTFSIPLYYLFIFVECVSLTKSIALYTGVIH